MSIFLLFILAFMALPVIKLVSSALTAQATQTFSFENFEKIFTSAYYAQSFGNSLKLSLQCSVFGIIIALFCSYAITRFVSERTQNNLLVIVNMTSNFAGLPLGFALTLMLGTTGVFVILLQQMVTTIYCAPEVRAYVAQLVAATRQDPALQLGASTRAAIALIHGAQACALLDGRDFILPEDVQHMVLPVLSHRLLPNPEARMKGITAEQVLMNILQNVAVPLKL